MCARSSSNDAKPRVLLVAGGTGGHISPGLALAESFVEAGLQPVFLSLERNRAYPDFSAPAFPLYYYDAPPIRKHPLHLLLFPLRFTAAFLRAWRLIGREDVRALVGLGGYPMAPAVLAGFARGLPVYLCEQNAVPGKVTRMLAGRARRLFLTIPLAESHTTVAPAEKLMLTGNPLRRRIVAALSAGASASGDAGAGPLAEPNLFETLAKRAGSEKKSAAKLRVLVVGGSQGAVQLNEMVKAALPLTPNVVWVLQCGARNEEALRAELSEEEYPGLHILGFTRDIHALYRTADVLVCRAGAGVLTEAAGFGLPLVPVPYPFAADNHQRANAEVFARVGAARLIDRRDTDPGELVAALDELSDVKTRKAMGAAAKKLARVDAARVIAARIKADLAISAGS